MVNDKRGITRRDVVIGTAAMGAGSGLVGRVRASQIDRATVRLAVREPERALPSRWLGFNAPANYDIPIEDPAFIDALTHLRPQVIRFPGGTVANYYDWHSGQLKLKSSPNGSIYRNFIIQKALPDSRSRHPNGVFVEQYARICRQLNAEMIVVPNLETSTPDDQAAWMSKMAVEGIKPKHIELGNEFYLALLMDPVSLQVWPNYVKSTYRAQQFVKALRPAATGGAKFAWQYAPLALHPIKGVFSDALRQHEREWNEHAKPEPWFDAVTVHLYPTIEGSAGSGSLARLPANIDKVFRAFIARADEGFARTIGDVISRMPGKEVWITEWGAFEPSATLGNAKADFNGLWLHMTIRGLMTMLRFPEVTVSVYHSLFASGNLMSAFRHYRSENNNTRSAMKYIPINATELIHWICDASRGPDAHYRRIKVEGTRRIVADGTVPNESYNEVDACLFRVGSQHTLFIHNAADGKRHVDLSGLVEKSLKLSATTIETPNLYASLQLSTPAPRPCDAGVEMNVPAYSITAVSWRI